MGIVEEIVNAMKTELDSKLTGYSRISYEYDILKNNERENDKGYGFIPGPAAFVEGRAMGFTTMDHTFTLIMVDTFQAKDDDSAMRTALFRQYELSQNVMRDLQKSKLTLPTPANRILLISGLSYSEPEVIEDSQLVVLRADLNIQYNFRNN